MSKEDWDHILTYKEEVIAGRTIMDIWSIDDIYDQAENNDMKLSEEDAINILCEIDEEKDAYIGINLDLIDIYLKDWRAGK